MNTRDDLKKESKMRSPHLGKYALRTSRKFELKDFHIEIAWHYGRGDIVAEVYRFCGKWDMVYGDSLPEIFGKIRLATAILGDEKFRKVHERVVKNQGEMISDYLEKRKMRDEK